MIYLDNAATTRPYDLVIERVCDVLKNFYGNPSSLHRLGMQAEDLITDARKAVADSVGAKEDEIYFSSSGTLANNTAILGYLRRNKRSGNTVIISSVEHSSVYQIGKHLEQNGYQVEWLPVKNFEPDWQWLEEHLDENTALVSMMAVNNETGTVFDIAAIRRIIEKKGLKTVVHSDCIQAYGKLSISARDFGADLMSFSGHKIGAPKGIGALYVRKGLLMEPMYFGGGQERDLFSGTENVANIVGFGEAVRQNSKHPPIETIKALSESFLKALSPDIKVNSRNSLGSIVNLSMNLRSEIILHMLESEGVYVSSGSACSQKRGGSNRVLNAFSIPQAEQDRALRISFSSFNTEEEVLIAAEKINGIYKKHKKN